jgi:hypothetical protein
MHRAPRPLSLALTFVLADCLAAPSFAQVGEKKETSSFTFGGPVTSVDTAKNTITIGGNTLFLVGDRLYVIDVAVPEGESEADAQRFLASVRFE